MVALNGPCAVRRVPQYMIHVGMYTMRYNIQLYSYTYIRMYTYVRTHKGGKGVEWTFTIQMYAHTVHTVQIHIFCEHMKV